MASVAPEGGLDGRSSADQVLQEQQDKAKGGGGEGERSGRAAAYRDWFELFVRAGVWALLIYQFVFQVSVVRGNSMLPNFHNEDRLLIDKLSLMFRDPVPGDVVVFEVLVVDSGQRVHRDYIKRIIGLPGDKVAIRDGKVWVNGQVLSEPWGPESFGFLDDSDVYVVPPGRLFVLGDNRGDSEDSRRSKIGFVPRRMVKGIVRWRFFPLERLRWF